MVSNEDCKKTDYRPYFEKKICFCRRQALASEMKNWFAGCWVITLKSSKIPNWETDKKIKEHLQN